MIAGFDTGYFIRLLEGNKTAVSVWKDLTDGNIDSVVNPLTLFELNRLALKGSVSIKSFNILSEAIEGMCHIAWSDNIDVLTVGAGISHGTGIPTVDSIIIASFLRSNVEKIYTTDSHFKAYKNKSISIIILK